MPKQKPNIKPDDIDSKVAAETLRVLIVDDEPNAREGLRDLLSSWGYETALAADGRAGFEAFKRFQPNVVLSDLVMPEMDGMAFLQTLRDEGLLELTAFILLSAHGNIDTAVEAIKQGAYDFLTKPLDMVRLKILLENLSKRSSLQDEMVNLKDKVRKLGTFGNLNGSTPKMKNIFKQIQIIAPTTASILILGESGTGKELVAKAIHRHSKRANKPYLSLNCAATPERMIENELFGHEKGAFEGASSQEVGGFELANQGTLFIDEISELSPDLQAKLLRVLETSTLRRIGGKKEIPIDVRVIAATNRNLEEAVEEGDFNEALFYRLNVLSIKLPPIRERVEDIPLLAQTFIEEFNLKNDRRVKGLSRDAMNILKKYSWPGNVRELKNSIERAVIVCRGDFIEPEDLPEGLTSKADKTPNVQFHLGQTMEEVEKHFLFHTINYVDGNKTKAAKMLDISLKTLHNKLAKYKSSI